MRSVSMSAMDTTVDTAPGAWATAGVGPSARPPVTLVKTTVPRCRRRLAFQPWRSQNA
jgi:hypothetical protein